MFANASPCSLFERKIHFDAHFPDHYDKGPLEGWTAYPIESWGGGKAVVKKLDELTVACMNDVNKLKMDTFGRFETDGHITFCKDYQDAINEAVASQHRTVPSAATLNTSWSVYRVTLTPRQMYNCYPTLLSAGESCGYDTWRFHGDLPLKFVDHSWYIIHINAKGYYVWQQEAVGPRTCPRELLAEGQCQT